MQSKRFVRANSVVTRQVASETVFVPIRSGAANMDFIYTSNETGTRIWECLDGQKSVDQIVETIGSEFDVPLEEAAKDTIDFLTAMEEAGLVKPV